MTTPRETSTPPAAKEITAKGNAMAVVLAQLAEAIAAAGAIWLRAHEHLSEQNLMIVFAAVLAGPAISHVRGKQKMPTTILMGGVGGAIVAAASKAKALL
jgi:hypothetical protein|tara:strand:+ start:452 stop:751 length:300 start_codon:yes stop_codon:yes gene_type:complete